MNLFVRMTGVSALVGAVWVLSILSALAAGAEQPSITVSASGSAQGQPDRAEVNAAVITLGDTAKATVDENSRIMNALLDKLRRAGFDQKTLATTQYDVSPQFQRPESGRKTPKISGYRVSSRLRVTVEDLLTVGHVLDQLTQAGVNQISGLRFSVSEPQGLVDTAIRAAMANAKHKAEVTAAAAGVTLGPVLKIDERGASLPQPRMMAFAERASVPVIPGEQSVQVSVSVTYGIAGQITN